MEEVASEKDENVDKSVLSPDHPLLEKFQKALKEHLLQQIQRLKDDIFQYETETKKKNAEREQLGVQTYEAQQMVCRQQKILENVVSEVQTLTAAKNEMDIELAEQKRVYKDLQDKFYQTEKTNRELQNEVDSMNLLIKQMSQWENKIESSIAVNKRVAEKTKNDHLQIAQEKKEQDLLIYRLLTEIWKLESEIETLCVQIKVKESEMEELEQSVAAGNTNVEALQAEYRCLMHAWNSVVVAIANRDKGLECLNEEIAKLQEKLKSTTAEIEQVKKLTKKELLENERFTMIKTRIEEDIKNCATQSEEEITKKNNIEKTMYELQAIVEQTEKDLAIVENENSQSQAALAALSKDFDKVAQKKYEMEETLLKNLQNQLSSNKVANNLSRILNSTKTKKRDLELIMNEAENKTSLLSSDMESQKYNNDENKRLLQEIQSQQSELEQEADLVQEEKDRYDLLFRKRERQLEVLNSKLEKISGKTEATTSPREMRTLELEKHIEETQAIIKKLQSFWLREQKNLLAVSNDRQDQIHNINLLKKQTLILEQKNIKINDEIDNYKKYEEKILQNINNLQNKGVTLCEALFKKRNQKFTLDRNYTLLQTEFESKLKDSELEILRIESAITDIEEDKINLSKELLEINREALEWEKKMHLAREAVGSMKQERREGGEVENMRQEIHRMEVILSQLKKAQAKLMKDLEYCVSRRDSIFTASEARLKREGTKVEDKTRVNFQRKMDTMKNKIKQMESDIKCAKVKNKELEQTKQIVAQKISAIESESKALKDYSVDMAEDLELSKTNKQFNFELLLVQQKKLNMYYDLSKGRNPYTVYRTEQKLASEYAKQKDLNGRLCTVLENLLTDFPNHQHALNRISNTLKIAAYTTMYGM